jgi:putative oxidoreductase
MLARALQPKTEAAYAFMRIIVGLLFGFHGVQALFGVLLPPEFLPHFGTQGWYGSVIELATGLLIAVGWLTPWAAFLASGTMAVAYVQFHWKFSFGAQFFPAANQGEPALMYSLLFLYMACKGAGIWSLDGRMRGRAGMARG